MLGCKSVTSGRQYLAHGSMETCATRGDNDDDDDGPDFDIIVLITLYTTMDHIT